MSNADSPSPSLKKLGAVRRKPVSIVGEQLVRTGPLYDDKPLPLLVNPAIGDVSLISWAQGNRDLINSLLLKHGGLLFRGFGVRAAEEFEEFARAVSGELLEYRERSSPRSQVSGNIYTSTDYPADHSIFLHNENSYQSVWPLKIFFFCAQAAREGGETPIADCRRVLERIRPATRQRFAEKGWMYVRNFGDGFGLDWETVFQTSDRAVVEEHCRRHGILLEWKDGGRLKTRAIRPAISQHPRTGETTWFNHATFFHITSMEPGIRDGLLANFKEEDLPTNTYYGDGTSIEPDVLEELREAYRQETVAFPWQQGDILLLDNMLAAHGRAPYAGARKVLVGMSEPVRRDEDGIPTMV
jgi:alpha-ketoglutarate-dependent taurine dioxygenase